MKFEVVPLRQIVPIPFSELAQGDLFSWVRPPTDVNMKTENGYVKLSCKDGWQIGQVFEANATARVFQLELVEPMKVRLK